MSILIQLLALCMLAAVLLTLWGVVFGLKGRRRLSTSREPLVQAKAPMVYLKGHEPMPIEPGVLLNTLWAQLSKAECQSGECGGCKLRLLEGQVLWIREPVAQVNKVDEFLACSCEAKPGSDLKCALPI
jgi:hypothetical protein